MLRPEPVDPRVAQRSENRLNRIIQTLETDPTFCALSAIAAILFVAVVVWVTRAHVAVESAAFSGFSPSWLANQVSGTPPFAADFPNGEAEVLKSLPMLVYPILGKLGVSGIGIFKVMLFLEIISVAVGALIATHLLRPNSSAAQGAAVAITLTASSLINCNFSMWWHPVYGSVYSYAYGPGLAGAALLIVGRTRIGAFLLALAGTAHPILGLLMLAFASSAVLADLKRYKLSELLQSALIFSIIFLGWTAYTMHDARLSGGAIPADLYIGLTRFMGSHWFPISTGMFGYLYFMALSPQTGFLLLLGKYLYKDSASLSGLDRQLGIGFLSLAAMTIAGIFISEYSDSPFLIKLAIHRANTILLLFGAIIVVAGLWRDAFNQKIALAVLAILVLLLPFGTSFGVPAALAAALTLPSAINSWRADFRSQRSIVYFFLYANFAVVVASLAARGFLTSHIRDAYFGADAVSSAAVISLAIAAILIVAALVLRIRTALMVLLCLGALYYAPTINLGLSSPSAIKIARDYLDVQQWARRNTPANALFMPDPAHAYGWREFSHRPSFGSLREWLYTNFAYNSNKTTFDEGLRRFSEFGLDLNNYLSMDPNVARREIPDDVRRVYYSAPKEWFERLATKYRIGYFVFERRRINGNIPIETTYENESYVVGRVAPPATSP
ncbi:hypothetical protein X566_19080 [Afipia sp. P52-10]|uniref:hypothetical protein n=1 Tax=Afipia sp. P52-10 TaxID=1429916 RepID=UPI0003DF349C|nr:hypothetical protein [Afipia sp. P52-10]ETR75871.1 hypothetical protein X566_19080 [Afipia sp. P52-10]